jgi:hypothetical protein
MLFKLVIGAVVILSGEGFAEGFGFDHWKILKSKHFVCFYKPEYRNNAENLLSSLEATKERVDKITGGEIKKANVVLNEAGLYSQGFLTWPDYSIHITTFPPHLGEMGNTYDWYKEVGVHEYTHLSQIKNKKGLNKVFSALFKGNPFFEPSLVPLWITEGIAVYTESQFSPYSGRLNDGDYRAKIGFLSSNNIFPSINEATHLPLSFFNLEGPYLFGGEFFSYLAERYGEGSVTEFFNIIGRQWWGNITMSILPFPFFTVDQAAKKAFGKGFPELWKEWKSSQERKFIREGERITKKGWMIKNPVVFRDKLYYIWTYPIKTGAYSGFWFKEIIEREIISQKERTVVRTTSDFSSPFQIKENHLYYAVYETRGGYPNSFCGRIGFYANLHRKELSSDKDQIIFSDEFRTFSLLPNGEVLYSKDKKGNFGSELYQYNEKENKSHKVCDLDYLINEIACNEENVFVVARPEGKSFGIYLLGTNSLTLLLDTPYLEGQILPFKDKILFCANYDQTYNIYIYSLNEKACYKITNSGFAQYPTLNEDVLYFVSLDEDGMDIFSKKVSFDQEFIPLQENSQEVYSWGDVELKEGNLKDLFLSLNPSIRSIYNPIFGGETNKWDMLLIGQDPTGRFKYMVGPVGYDTEKRGFDTEFAGICFDQALKPLRISLARDFEEEETTAGITYPHFIERKEKGLSSLSFGSELSFKKERKVFTPWSGWEFTYPSLNTGAYLSFPTEIRGSKETVGIKASLFGKMHIPKNKEIGVMIKGGSNLATPTSVAISGYDKIESTRFISTSWWYSFPLGKTRKGLWNPNIYLGDNFGVFWSSFLFPQDKSACFSFGAELNIEGSSLFGANRFIIAPGIAITKDKKTMIYFEVRGYWQNKN